VTPTDYRAILLGERERVEHSLKLLHVESPASNGDEAEEETVDNHLGDAASVTLAREIDNSLEDNLDHVREAINLALKRLEEGTFGTCTSCGKMIAAARLEAMPYATKCIECKRLEERG
jgi:RNA polymerase-binding transcription factor DksA